MWGAYNFFGPVPPLVCSQKSSWRGQGLDGKTALEVAKSPEVKELLQKPEIATAWWDSPASAAEQQALTMANSTATGKHWQQHSWAIGSWELVPGSSWLLLTYATPVQYARHSSSIIPIAKWCCDRGTIFQQMNLNSTYVLVKPLTAAQTTIAVIQTAARMVSSIRP